jgi:anhydro-N-acetylmuramic acid kinase
MGSDSFATSSNKSQSSGTRWPEPQAFIGLMSGTSLDAVDGAIVEFSRIESSGKPEGVLQLRTIASTSIDIPPALRTCLRLLASAEYQGFDKATDGNSPDPIEEAALASNALSDLYLNVIENLRAFAPLVSIQAIGAHGQTIRHRPDLGFTLQLINGARIAALSELPTICDFRSADLALGGQGAPLVPLFHQDALAIPGELRAILNLGGIANLSILKSDSTTGAEQVAGFDTGPASTLLDTWAQKHLGKPFDPSGSWAASGTSNQAFLEFLLNEPFFELPAPKSTGRELFSLAWLESKRSQFKSMDPLSNADVQATLSRLTARSIAQAAKREIFVDEKNEILSVKQVSVHFYACGGGVKNTQLMADIEDELQRAFGTKLKLRKTSDLGIDPQQMEACAFAWLAWKRWNQEALNYAPVTGSRRRHCAGAIYLP